MRRACMRVHVRVLPAHTPLPGRSLVPPWTRQVTSLAWGGFTLNAVDTPGHADFGGEVER